MKRRAPVSCAFSRPFSRPCMSIRLASSVLSSPKCAPNSYEPACPPARATLCSSANFDVSVLLNSNRAPSKTSGESTPDASFFNSSSRPGLGSASFFFDSRIARSSASWSERFNDCILWSAHAASTTGRSVAKTM